MSAVEPFANLGQVEAVLADEALDAVVASAPENVTYLSGFWAMTHWIRRGPQAYVFWPREGRGEASIVCGTGVIDLVADQEIWVDRVRRFGYFAFEGTDTPGMPPVHRRQVELIEGAEFAGPVEALVDAIRAAGLEKGRIAVDEIGMTPQAMDRLRAALPDLAIVPAFEIMRRMRRIKTAEEVARLRRACNITEDCIEASLAVAAEGLSELEMARVFNRVMVENDALPVLGCIGFGHRSALINAQPSEARLRKGDLIRFDVGGRYRHYRADIARIGVYGEPDPQVRSRYEALRNGVEVAHEIIRPGMKASVLFDRVMETVRKSGMPDYKRSHVGHGIGIDGYDLPSLSPESDAVLEAGMVICVETPYYDFGLGGLQVEDMIHVTPTGCESLMSRGSELRVIEP